MDYAQEIYKLIASYLPLTPVEIGNVLPALSVSKSGDSIIMELSEDDYSYVNEIMSDDSNYSFTTGGFRIKDRVTEMLLYPEGATSYFAFKMKFERPIFKNAGDDIQLKGFADTAYNTNYRVVRKVTDYELILAPLNDAAIQVPSGNKGFYPIVYSSGLNGMKIIQDAGDNSISFEIEPEALSGVDSIDDIDLSIMPNLWYYQKNILAMNFETFKRNLTDGATEDYLILDTTSFSGSPMRQKFNNTDAPYFSFTANAFYSRNYSLNINYILQRSVDTDTNQTKSGSDIVDKQVKMHDALTSILRRPLPSDSRKTISAMTITEDSVDSAIIEGAVVIGYKINFSITYLPESILDLSDDGAYPINKVKYNSDEILV